MPAFGGEVDILERLTLGVLGRSPRLAVNLENKEGVLLPSDSGFKKRNPKVLRAVDLSFR